MCGRDWVRHVEKKNAAAGPRPVDVSRQSAGLNFKKVDQKQTVFEVAALEVHRVQRARTASFARGDVRITIFGKAGDRPRRLFTPEAVSTERRKWGESSAGGEVQIDLMSAAGRPGGTGRAPGSG